jgi:hypothetical protein
MRFLALFGVLIGDGAMVIYSPPPIKMGRAWSRADAGDILSPRQPEHQQERAVQLFGRFRVDAANDPPNAVAAKRDQSVRHDPRPQAKTVFRRNVDQRSERKFVLRIGRDRADQD